MRLWKQGLLALAVIGAGVIIWAREFPAVGALLERAGIATASVEAPRGGGGPGAAPLPVVRGAPAGQATINDTVAAIGDGRASRSVTLVSTVPGRVAAVEVAAGDRVVAGAPVVRLESAAEAIALDRARLDVADARDTLERAEELARARALSDVQVRAARLAAGQAALAEREAARALEDRVIRAPFDGWVGILGVDVGDQVDSDTEIATLDDRTSILVDFRLPERFVGQVRVGAPVEARPLARPGMALAGTVATLDSRVDPATRTLRVRARLGNGDDLLRAGMAFAIAMRFAGESYPSVDPLAIQWSADGAYVWVAGDGGKAARLPVRIIQRNNDAVLVEGALAPGTMVVTEGVQLLRPGLAFRFEGTAPAMAGG